MPDKPIWLGRLPEAIRQLEGSTEPWIDRPTLELLLGVGRRSAQQLLAPIAIRRVGTSAVASSADLIAHLKRMAAGEEAYYEERRRKKLSAYLDQAREEWLRQPPVWVEVSETRQRRMQVHDFDGLPEGVELGPGSIQVRFGQPHEALQKLMALAIAISQNPQAFDARVSMPHG